MTDHFYPDDDDRSPDDGLWIDADDIDDDAADAPLSDTDSAADSVFGSVFDSVPDGIAGDIADSDLPPVPLVQDAAADTDGVALPEGEPVVFSALQLPYESGDVTAESAPITAAEFGAPVMVSSAYRSAEDERADEIVPPVVARTSIMLPAQLPSRGPVRTTHHREWPIKLVLVIFIAIGAWLRFDGQNWDDYTHLHPDERFLTSVVTQLNGPLSLTDSTQQERDEHLVRCQERYPAMISSDEYQSLIAAGSGPYFDAECSPLNPNNLGNGSYVYGEFPLFTVHAAGVARSQFSADYHAFLEAYDPDLAAEHTITTHWEGYSGVQLIGRSVSALADTLTILFLFLLGRRLYNPWVGLLAAGLYAVAGFPIQQAHFWTVDSFTTFWVTVGLYFASRALDGIGARRGAVPLFYLLIWAGGTVWDAAYQEYSMLGLVTLGGAFVLSLLITSLIEAGMQRAGRAGGDIVVAASGVVASVLYLAGWTVLIAVRLDGFTLRNEITTLGIVSLAYAAAVLVAYVAVGIVRRHLLGVALSQSQTLAIGSVGVVWIMLASGFLVGGLSPWGSLFVALAAVTLMITDVMELTDYLLFGLALGGAVASRINIAPLAGIIVLAAGLRALPALDRRLDSMLRSRLVMLTMVGVFTAALAAIVAFRLLQPHAFLGPEIWGLKINPAWREDMSSAAYYTSGDWDAPPNHQWASRIPYLFPWRNIVEWGLGIPLGLLAWGAWAWSGVAMLRARRLWTRHAIPFFWILVIFGWLGGRWVTTMRYFLPIYPTLVLFGAWALYSLVVEAWRVLRERRADARRHTSVWRTATASRLAFALAIVLLIGTVGYTTVYGFAVHNIHRHQLTRVAASRWFQETVPGDIGIWVEGDDGTRQMVSIGRGAVATPMQVFRLEDGVSTEVPFTLMSDVRLDALQFNLLRDPALDDDPETLRVRILRDTTTLGRSVVFEGTIDTDLNASISEYGQAYQLQPSEPVLLSALSNSDQTLITYVIEVTVVAGGPVTSIREMYDPPAGDTYDMRLDLSLVSDGSSMSIDLNFDTPAIITGHGDDIPVTPTHWSATQASVIAFDAPIDGVIETLEIPHLGDPLGDADAETIHFTLTAPDGTTTTATVTQDFSTDAANPVGLPTTVTFDPPLVVTRLNENGEVNQFTLTVDAEDPLYTSGPVIAWEGDWDDSVPWPVCPLESDVVYQDDLPSGLSSYNCASLNVFSNYYQGLKLWAVAEDTDDKRDAMLNALDQADYIVITSNRFYDSLSRIPWRWPMTLAYYDALFDGELGFELVRTFESPPQIGPFRFDDQILPTDDLPDWLNEQWESEEAFSVYDHPVVLVYKKTADYSSENAAATLDSVSRRQARTATTSYVVDTEPVGVVNWGAKQATEAPTLLHLTEEKWEEQQSGGTWSDLFDLDALVNRSQVVAVIAWWLLFMIAGWLAWPLLFVTLPALPDRGFPAAKITVWLIVAWIAWVGGTADLPAWSRGGLALILLGVALLSLLLIWRRRAQFLDYIRANWRYLLAIEALGVVLYAVLIGVRLTNPDLWHGSFGGEKPMDFAYFNAVLRSTVFPPLDPWFSGGYINYYYWGYVLVGAPVKLLAIRPALAYNLIIPALYSMTGLGVFSIAYNWVRSRRVTPGDVFGATRDVRLAAGSVDDPDDEDADIDPRWHLPRGNPWVAGLLALVLAVVLGNLATLRVFVTNTAKLDDGGYTEPDLYSQVREQEIEAQRTELYQKYYNEALSDFRNDNDGRDPSSAEEIYSVTQQAQDRTDAYIDNYTNHPYLWDLWKYEIDNNLDLISAFFGGLNKLIDGYELPMASHRWYWAPTRIISELPNGAGRSAIAEMPYFTFLYGDLHAHMLAFPITLLVLLWLVSEIIGAGHRLRHWYEAGLALGLGALAVGVLRPTNSWDWITYLLLSVAALVYVGWIDAARVARDRGPSPAFESLWSLLTPERVRDLAWALFAIPLGLVARIAYYLVQHFQADQQAKYGLSAGEEWITPAPLTLSSALVWALVALALVIVVYVALLIAFKARINRGVVVALLGRIGGFLVLSTVAALPFTMYFATAYNAVKPWELETTPLWAYLYIHGTFIFIVIGFLTWQSARWLRRVTVRDLQGQVVPVLAVAGIMLVVVVIGIAFGVRRAAVAELVIPLIAWSTLMFFLPEQHRLLRAIYALTVLALAISLGVELVVLDGDIGRQNTVFKFYLQVWFMLSIVGGVTLAWMLHSTYRWQFWLQSVWYGGLVILFTIGFMYPVLATQARALDRFAKDETPLTLDGMEYMEYAIHGEHDLWFPLQGDYDMIRWLQDNVEGTPVVAEAHLYPSEYHWGGRISIYTGLPTILGWRFHQTQQHSLTDMIYLVQTRENNVAAFYETAGEDGIRTALKLADYYDVEYIVVGALERAFYDDIVTDATTLRQTAGHSEGLKKFDTMVELGLLTEEYAAPRCLDYGTAIEECSPDQVYIDKIYRIVPGALDLFTATAAAQ